MKQLNTVSLFIILYALISFLQVSCLMFSGLKATISELSASCHQTQDQNIPSSHSHPHFSLFHTINGVLIKKSLRKGQLLLLYSTQHSKFSSLDHCVHIVYTLCTLQYTKTMKINTCDQCISFTTQEGSRGRNEISSSISAGQLMLHSIIISSDENSWNNITSLLIPTVLFLQIRTHIITSS